MKRLATLLIPAGVTLATLAYALWGVDLGALWATLIGGRLWVVAPFLLLLAVFLLSNAQRWQRMMRPFGRFGLGQLLPPMMIGFAANNLLPLRVGELIRAYLVARDLHLPKSGVLMNLALERLLDLIGILVIYLAALALVADAPAGFRASAWIASAAVLGLALILASFVLIPKTIDRLWNRAAAGLPGPIRARGSVYLGEFERGLSPMREPATATWLILYSVGRWLLAVGLAWLCIHAYVGDVPFPVAMITIGITAFAVALPSAPGFVGPMQAAFVFALTPFGIEREAALAASLLFLLGHWVPITAVGAAFLTTRHLSLRELARRAEEPEPAPAPDAGTQPSRT
jgi:uncharacterized protein (TIRG00374 family)